MEYLLDDSWKDIKSFIPFGYGRVGKRVLPKLQEDFIIPFVIDNNPCYAKQEQGFSILTLDEAIKVRKDEKIVVLTVETAYADIRKRLIDKGLEEYKDFCILERFLGEWFLKYQNKCVLSKIDTSITFRCTLNCKHCAMFTVYGDRYEQTVGDIKKNIDSFFKIVDYVLEFTLLGGEPLIHSGLEEILNFLSEKYVDKIGQIVIISNGNVHLKDSTYKLIKKYDVILSISDYTEVHNYRERLGKFIAELEKRKIRFYYNREMEWKDHGYPKNPCAYPDEKAKEHLKLCGHTTHSMNEGRLYYCDAMYGAEKNTGYATEKDDYLDFKELIQWIDTKKAKERVIEYCFGEINDKGFPSFCKVCAGIGHDNSKIIRAGE